MLAIIEVQVSSFDTWGNIRTTTKTFRHPDVHFTRTNEQMIALAHTYRFDEDYEPIMVSVSFEDTETGEQEVSTLVLTDNTRNNIKL